jgi:hypothetical protein
VLGRILFVFLALAGCGGTELDIQQNQVPARPLCELPLAPTPTTITSGTFDLAIGDRSSYLLAPLVENRTGSAITVDTVRVTLTWENDGVTQPLAIRCDGGETCSEWELDACEDGCPVVPANGAAAFTVPIIPRVVTAYFRDQLDRAVREGRVPPEFTVTPTAIIEGTSEDGSLAISEEYTMPVRICLGCLVEFPPDSDSPAIAGPDCCGTAPAQSSCLLGQDGPIDCRHCIRTLPEICNFGRLSCGT